MLPAYYSSKYCIEIYITFNLRHEDNRLGLLVEQSSSILYTNAKLAELIPYVAIPGRTGKFMGHMTAYTILVHDTFYSSYSKVLHDSHLYYNVMSTIVFKKSYYA